MSLLGYHDVDAKILTPNIKHTGSSPCLFSSSASVIQDLSSRMKNRSMPILEPCGRRAVCCYRSGIQRTLKPVQLLIDLVLMSTLIVQLSNGKAFLGRIWDLHLV